MSALARAMVPLVTIGLGTWVGLGRPDAGTAVAAGARAACSATACPASPPGVPAVEPGLAVDPSLIPDPRPAWPSLNPDDSAARAWLLTEGPAHRATDGRRLVTFTFDDGPFPETAALLLGILREHRIRATFFFIGEYLTGASKRAEESRIWAKRIADEGHYVGNHTFDHRRLTGMSHAEALSEIDDSAAAIERATGKRPSLFRPPYGALDPWLERALRDRHQELLLWNVDVHDIHRTDAAAIAQQLQDQLDYERGGIVLLHDMHRPSVNAFARVVRWLEAHKWDEAHPDRAGWQIVDLAEYLSATAASPQPYATRDELERARENAAADERTKATISRM